MKALKSGTADESAVFILVPYWTFIGIATKKKQILYMKKINEKKIYVNPYWCQINNLLADMSELN
jgi:hypothetical protein